MKKLALYCIAMLISFFGGVFCYNQFFHPLKQVSESIALGEDCDSAKAKVQKYLDSGGFYFEPSFIEHPVIYRNIKTYASSSKASGYFINQGPIFSSVTLAFRCDAKNDLVDQVVYD